MSDGSKCPVCGKEIPGDAPGGLCPECLLARALEDSGGETVLSDEPLGVAVGVDFDVIPEAPGRYTMLGEHAKGGMGRVLLVHDETLGRDVALKELLPEYVEDAKGTPTPVRHSKEMASRFLREARITGQLEHPSITPVHELGRRPDGTLYYTMKLVKGRTLAKAIRDCKTLEERLKLLPHFVDLCNAIAYAHSRGVIHRDIKPQNVMVGDYGETVILDWGLAKAKAPKGEGPIDDTAQTLVGVRPDSKKGIAGVKTMVGEIMGTPAYMSPEQARGEEADEKSDIYALGAVLYEILTGRPLYEGKTASEIVEKVAKGEYKAPRAAQGAVSRRLDRICRHALAPLPSDRPDSALNLGHEIESIGSRIEYLNPMRPYLSDLVPEVRQFDRKKRRALLREGHRLRRESQDAYASDLVFGAGYLMILLIWTSLVFYSLQLPLEYTDYLASAKYELELRAVKADPDFARDLRTWVPQGYHPSKFQTVTGLDLTDGNVFALAGVLIFMLISTFPLLVSIFFLPKMTARQLEPYVRKLVAREMKQ